jgi:predicted nucleic acid-binding protein
MATPQRIGADTSLLVAHSLVDHPDHGAAERAIRDLLGEGGLLALCPVVIDEFIHVVTDPRRFERALGMPEAIGLAQTWCQSRETLLLHPSDESLRLQLAWLLQFRLGRKRLHDTQIAAIYHLAGIKTVLTSNWRDFGTFGCFEVRTL